LFGKRVRQEEGRSQTTQQREEEEEVRITGEEIRASDVIRYDLDRANPGEVEEELRKKSSK
jgi:hypothetical protein